MPAKKNPKKTDPMLGALAASFGPSRAPTADPKSSEKEGPHRQIEGEGNQHDAAPAPPKEEPSPKPVAAAPPASPPKAQGAPQSPSSAPPRYETAGVKKTTVSFHDTEQDQVDLILDALKRCRRHRGGFSDAIKIALRLCPLDEASIGRAWDEARAQDQRVLRHRRDS